MFYFALLLILSAVEIGGNTSPKYRGRYCIVDNFDRLPIDQVVSIFSHSWIICVPFFEIDVNVTIEYFVCVVGGCMWMMVVMVTVTIYHLFRCNVCCVTIGVVFGVDINHHGLIQCCSLPFWKNKFTWFDDDFVYLTKSCFIDDGCQFLMSDSS